MFSFELINWDILISLSLGKKVEKTINFQMHSVHAVTVSYTWAFCIENDSALLLVFSSPLVGNQALQDAAKYITISRLKHLTKGSCVSKPLTRLDNWYYLKFWQSTVSRELKDRRLTLLQFWSSMFSSSLNHGLQARWKKNSKVVLKLSNFRLNFKENIRRDLNS